MNLNEYLDWVEERGLTTKQQVQVMERLNADGRSIGDVSRADLDDLATNIGVLAKAVSKIVNFFRNLF